MAIYKSWHSNNIQEALLHRTFKGGGYYDITTVLYPYERIESRFDTWIRMIRGKGKS